MDAIFDKSCSYEKARLILLGAPWEVTASYGGGTSDGPRWIQQASSQLDFFDLYLKKNPSQEGIHFLHLDSLKKLNDTLWPQAQQCIKDSNPNTFQAVNQGCQQMVKTVQKQTQKILKDNKLFGLIGGDHSVSEGAVFEIAQKYNNDFGLLHLDAHADMRKCYQGFTHSHASVLYNIAQKKHSPKTIVQMGIRDICEEEYQFIDRHPHIHSFFGHEMKKQLFEGKTWREIIQPALNLLPQNVYISFDIDALSWEYAPHTGCPVPGGLSFDQAVYLFHTLHEMKKNIVGFDVVEVSKPSDPTAGEWDGNVGARLIYKLCGLSLKNKNPQ